MKNKGLILIILMMAGFFLFGNYVQSEEMSIPNFHKVDTGIYRGARPREKGIMELKRMGIKAIVNLERELFKIFLL